MSESPQPLTSNSHITTLLEFQNKFINTVHSQIYSQSQISEQSIVKFQVNHITDLNQSWKSMIEELYSLLVGKKIPYHHQLRDYFHKVLGVQYLPLLRINRYEITQLSLFGFDIYVDPLSAILQIINRIDGLKHPILQGKENAQYKNKQGNIWQSLKSGWSNFIYESNLYKISLNIYILKEYLKIGAKSLVRKDKEIVFTGCSNMFTTYTQKLKELKQIWLLCEMSQLNNQLYQFHPSYNYSEFFSLMFPILPQYQPVFAPMQEIALKCANTNILTPLLLALLRHHEIFNKFIKEADNQIWAPYLSALAFGLILNFKARILEYEEVMVILKATIQKLGLMNKVDLSYIAGELGKEWKEARQFFISALKAGYNAGDLQTWHPTPHMQVQQKIIQYTRNALFLNTSPDQQNQAQLFIGDENENYLKKYLGILTGDRISLQQFTTNYNNKLVEQIPIDEEYNYNLLKLTHIFRKCETEYSENPHVLAYFLYFYTLANPQQSQLLIKANQKAGEYLNQKAIQILQKTKSQNLKQALYEYDTKYLKKLTKDKLLLYLKLQNPKIALQKIFKLLHDMTEQDINLIGAGIIALYGPQNLDSKATLKTFEKEYEVPEKIVNLPNKVHSSLSFLIQQTIFNKQQKSRQSLQIIKKMAQIQDWLTIPIVTFPINFSYESMKQEKLQSFFLWFIKNKNSQQMHSCLLEILKRFKNQQIKQYFTEIVVVNICENIINQINLQVRNESYKDAIMLLNLLQKIHPVYCKINNNNQLYKKMTQMYIRLMPKLQPDTQFMKKTLDSYGRMLQYLLGSQQNLNRWRIMHNKLVSVATSVPVQSIKNFQTIWLPSIKDNAIFSQGYGQLKSQQPEYNEQSSKRIDELLKRICKETKDEEELKIKKWKPLQSSRVRESDVKELVNEYQEYKDHIPSLLNENLIKQILTQTQAQSQKDDLIHYVCILCLTPTNANEVLKWSVDKENIQMLQQLGYSKQANNLPYQIFKIICNDEDKRQEISQKMTQNLDDSSKEAISQGFTLLDKHLQYLIKLPKFDFLISENQSNWRFANEKLSSLAASINIPSIILQYTQYLRITKTPNQEYNQKIKIFEYILGKYTRILKRKQYRLFNQQHPIEKEELELLKTNQMANLKIFTDSANLKDLLIRLVQFQVQVQKFNVPIQLSILQNIQQINKIANKLVQGHIINPNFLLSNKLSSANTIENYNFQIGLHLENYYTKRSKDFSNTYVPLTKQSIQFEEFIKRETFPSPTQITNSSQKNKQIKAQIDKLKVDLQQKNALQVDGNALKLKKVEQSSPQLESAFYKLGYCVKVVGENAELGVLLKDACERNQLSWEYLKDFDMQNYHHIKSVLIDDEIGKRKLNMTMDGKQLVKNGQKIQVNQLNKEKYCNLMAIRCIGEGILKNAQSFGRGYCSAQ